jgi:hypothetical protein
MNVARTMHTSRRHGPSITTVIMAALMMATAQAVYNPAYRGLSKAEYKIAVVPTFTNIGFMNTWNLTFSDYLTREVGYKYGANFSILLVTESDGLYSAIETNQADFIYACELI